MSSSEQPYSPSAETGGRSAHGAAAGAGRQEKARVRALVRARRDAMDAAARAQGSAAITAKLLALEPLLAARTVLGYATIGSEFDTGALLRALLAQGKQLVLPRIDKVNRRLQLAHVVSIERDTNAAVWGIREPLAACREAAAEEVDLVIVPSLSLDPAGGRVGYGGGYYDELLARLRPQCWRIAAAFDEQMLERVPSEAHDQRVHWIVTPTREYRLRECA